MANVIELQIRGDDRASAVIKDFARAIDRAAKDITDDAKKASKSWDGLNKAMDKSKGIFDRVKRNLFSLKGALVGLGLVKIAKDTLGVAASFEQMEIKLNALTGGKGKETLEALNKLALDLPVNTRKLVDSFTMMMAMGLKPTEESLITLTDVASIFGEDALPRVARALGQMASLGRLSAEELNQLSEVGINARKYLTQAFGMTVEELQKANVAIEDIIDVIWKGLAEEFGGAAREAQHSWQGLTSTFMSYVDEISRQVMAAGVFDALKEALNDINEALKNWLQTNEALIRQKVPEWVEKTKGAIAKIWEIISYDPAILEWGLIGLALGGKKFGVLAGGIAHIGEMVQNQYKAFKLWRDGVISFTDVAKANFKELEQLVQKGEQIQAGPTFRGRIPARPGAAPRLPTVTPRAAAPVRTELSKEQKAELKAWADVGNQFREMDEAFTNERVKELEKREREEKAAADRALREQKRAYEEMKRNAEDTAESMSRSFSDLFFDVMSGGFEGLQGLADRVLQSLQSKAADILGELAGQALGGLFGKGGGGIGDFFASLFHSGGVAGVNAMPRRSVSPWVFAGAPRLHNGLRPDEMPAILQKGERVVPKKQAGEAVNVTFNISTPDITSFRASQGQILTDAALAMRRARRNL